MYFLWDLNKINMDNIRNPISSSSYLRLANFYAKNLAKFFSLLHIWIVVWPTLQEFEHETAQIG